MSRFSAAWVGSLEPNHRAALAAALTPRLNRFIPHEPTLRQRAFLVLPQMEALFGGAAGGGKSDALLMGALQYVDVPGYSALLLRRTYAQLSKADSLIPRSHEWLRGTGAKWSEVRMSWTFPSGARLEFGHLQHENDKYNYQGPAYQFIGFDELTGFSESQYRFLFSRLRRLEGSSIPVRMRSGSNPGGVGHDWVKMRFPIMETSERAISRAFIPSKLADNPHLDRTEYEKSLAELDPITKAQLLDGDWTARQFGGMFKRENFEIVPEAPSSLRGEVRYWDLAGTEAKGGSSDPDWTVGTRGGESEGVLYLTDVQRFRGEPGPVEARIRQTARADGRAVTVWIEQEPGASGKIVIDHYRRNVLSGFAVRPDRVTGSKTVRAQPFSAAADAGLVKLVAGRWIPEFFDELEAFPYGPHDDQTDSGAGCHAKVMIRRGFTMAAAIAANRGKPEEPEEPEDEEASP